MGTEDFGLDRLSVLNLPFAEDLYARFVEDPGSVPADWRACFESLAGSDPFAKAPPPRLGPSFPGASLFARGGGDGRMAPGPASRPGMTDRGVDVAILQDRVNQLARSYRVRGHRHARLDPLGRNQKRLPELSPEFYGLTGADLDQECSLYWSDGPETLTVRDLVDRLESTYCRYIGVQFYHIDDIHLKTWLQERMERTRNRIALTRQKQQQILTRLTDAVMFEEFIQRKYTGAKSFSLEGGESLIPLLHLAIEKAGEQGLDEIVLGMAHRGRLNVLANIMGKSARDIFREFDDADPERFLGGGDVKYHLGFSSNWRAACGQLIHLSLCFNPSHLEFVDPVVLGRVRAKQDRVGDRDRVHGMSILIHGDAAFAGEGVIQETLNLSELDGFTVGGTMHVVVNNQIGFTTPPPESRSSTYATDVAKMLQIPIFHVNGEDPEAVAQVVDLAMEFRLRFKRDVVVDMYCYRRRGHNEGDEPAFTQPLMVQAIEQRPPVREGYLDHLLTLGGITREQADEIAARRRAHLEVELEKARGEEPRKTVDSLKGIWVGYEGGPESAVADVDTGRSAGDLASLMDGLTRVPDGFKIHARVERVLRQRREMAGGERALDWASAELLAFATLATEGYRIRLCGQDSQRGTFSQRHALLHDQVTGAPHAPIQHLVADQAPVEIVNSPLSEAGVLGFEYGYSLDFPECLVLWEAQFGDFVNVAQVIIDQFISSAEDKWKRLSGLVMLLPHGFEGQGPEHSSARLERFLQLCAEDNMQVAVPSCAAQYFHLLRRQMLRRWRKPLIVMTPKGLLRLPEAGSRLGELAEGRFHRVLPDAREARGRRIERVLVCSGRIYHDLIAKRTELGREDVAIVRIEQLYPFPAAELSRTLGDFADQTPLFWVQDEPENMGAWRYIHHIVGDRVYGRFPFQGIHRPESASPATGSAMSHKHEQKILLEKAFGVVE